MDKLESALRIIPAKEGLTPDHQWEHAGEEDAKFFVIMSGDDDEEIADFGTRRECEAFILGWRARAPRHWLGEDQ